MSRADVVLVTIGANDLADGLAQWQDGGCDGAGCFAPPSPAYGNASSRSSTGSACCARAGRPSSS